MGNEESQTKETESMLIIKRMHNKVDSIKRELYGVLFNTEKPVAIEEPSSPLLMELRTLERSIEQILDSIKL